MKGKINFTDAEMAEVAEICDRLENETYRSTGVRRISGGFSTADAKLRGEQFEGEPHVWDITLKWGVQSDVQNDVHTEEFTYTIGSGYDALHDNN